MICDKCKKEVGPLFCGNCRCQVKQESAKRVGQRKLIPLLYYNPVTGRYVPGCNCTECPWNIDNTCVTEWSDLENMKMLFHAYDGDNIIHQVCG